MVYAQKILKNIIIHNILEQEHTDFNTHTQE